jgi:hypothetical protein
MADSPSVAARYESHVSVSLSNRISSFRLRIVESKQAGMQQACFEDHVRNQE